MSYYDFNDHFWSPREVCLLAPQKEIQKGFFKVLFHALREVFVDTALPSINDTHDTSQLLPSTEDCETPQK
jgi:hypothetical protein